MNTTRMVATVLVLLAICGWVAAGTQPATRDDNAQPTASFRIPEQSLNWVKEVARAEASQTPALKDRRPQGLEKIDTSTAVGAAVQKAISDLGDKGQHDNAVERLRYLGVDAFDALQDGAFSQDPLVAQWCCDTLGHRGKKAVPILCAVMESKAPAAVRSAAAQSLGQTFEADGVPALIAALDDKEVRVAALHALLYPRDKRAIEPLRKLVPIGGIGHAAQQSIDHIQAEQGYDWWPSEYRDLLQLCRDAHTLKGERYGKVEREELIRGLNIERGNIVYSCQFALA